MWPEGGCQLYLQQATCFDRKVMNFPHPCNTQFIDPGGIFYVQTLPLLVMLHCRKDGALFHTRRNINSLLLQRILITPTCSFSKGGVDQCRHLYNYTLGDPQSKAAEVCS